jgi:hypothetical protein
MGGNSSQSKQSTPCKTLPKFSYLNRREGKLLVFESSQPNVDSLPQEVRCYNDSALCESEGVIFVAGGSESSKNLNSLFFSIDTNSPRVKLLEDLPIPSKCGYLFPHKSSFFYAGGVSIDSLTRRKIQSPIMRYNILKETWEIFNHSNLSFGKKKNLQFKNLRKPGFAIIKNKLLLFGGYFRVGNQRVPNIQCVSFDLSCEGLDWKFESLNFPVSLYSPVVGCFESRAVIAGGKLMDSSRSSDIVEFKKSSFKLMKKKKLTIIENHPPIYQKTYIIIFAFPKVHIQEKKTKDWLQFSLPSNPATLLPVEKNRSETLFRKPLTFSPNSTGGYKSSDSFNPIMTFGSDTARSLGVCTNIEDLDLDIDFIMQIETDEKVTVFHKQAIRLFGFACEKLEGKKLTPLEINQISTQLGFKGFVNILEISAVLTELLQRKGYEVAGLLKFYQIVHKVLDRPRIRSGVILMMLRMNEINKTKECITASVSVFVMTRIIKITVVGV